jgi:hypothetical protein
MAHFAELDENNVVLRVVVIDNKDTSDVNGVEKEYIGAAFCERIFGGRWVQTSYNNRFRKRYAGIGLIYNAEIDAFVAPQPHPSWTLNPTTAHWEPPVPKPEEGDWAWDESSLSWVPFVPAPPAGQ